MARKKLALAAAVSCAAFSCALIPLAGMEVDGYISERYLQIGDDSATLAMALAFAGSNALAAFSCFSCLKLAGVDGARRASFHVAASFAGTCAFLVGILLSLRTSLPAVAVFIAINALCAIVARADSEDAGRDGGASRSGSM